VHLSQGLKSLHEKKILHRDLKCANIFITGEGVYKIGDLNVSKVAKQDLARTQTGTPYYASP
jgi:NIMA (never in mitosis gene a)-related kinase